MTDAKSRFPMLVIDTASRRICVALIVKPGTDVATSFSDEEASLSLFPTIKILLQGQAIKLSQLRSIAFCEGPGSILGIRTAIMGIRVWAATRQIDDCNFFSFNSLQVGSKLVKNSPSPPTDYLVVTDARRQSWNCLNGSNENTSEVALIENTALEQAPQVTYSFNEFPNWTRTQANIIRLSYRPESIFQNSAFPDLLRSNPTADPLNTRTLEFAKWIPQARTADRIES